jgi:ABC-type antimicrobial peptide transport system permease subunit
MNKVNFFKHFGLPEFKSIAGNRGKNLIILTLIVLIAMLAIGIGNGATKYLEIKMDNPFIKFVNVTIPYGKDPDLDKLNAPDLKSRYGYTEIEPVYFRRLTFVSNSGKAVETEARLIEKSSKLYNFLSNNSQIALSNMFFDDDVYGCVVTQEYLKKLELEGGDPGFTDYINFQENDTIPIRVLGILRELPDNADMLLTKTFDASIDNHIRLNVTNGYHDSYLRFYIPKLSRNDMEYENLGFEPLDAGFVSADAVLIERNGGVSSDVIQGIRDIYPNAKRVYDYKRSPTSSTRSSPRFDKISFSFENLDSVSVFSSFVKSKYGLLVDMNTIEAKKHFDFFNKLSNMLSLSLISFSVFSIFIFIINLILNHIESNKMSLGTLKAFGLSNNSIIEMYATISIAIIAIAFFIAYCFTLIFGQVIFEALINIMRMNLDEHILYSNFPLIVLLVTFIVIPVGFVYYRLWSRLKNSTPGDLIYDR